jgi:hypothetical protein
MVQYLLQCFSQKGEYKEYIYHRLSATPQRYFTTSGLNVIKRGTEIINQKNGVAALSTSTLMGCSGV